MVDDLLGLWRWVVGGDGEACYRGSGDGSFVRDLVRVLHTVHIGVWKPLVRRERRWAVQHPWGMVLLMRGYRDCREAMVSRV